MKTPEQAARLVRTIGLVRGCLAALGAAVALGSAPALAHHSFAMFDNTKNLPLEGPVKEFQWTNPHSWVQIEIKNDKQIESWDGSARIRVKDWPRLELCLTYLWPAGTKKAKRPVKRTDPALAIQTGLPIFDQLGNTQE